MILLFASSAAFSQKGFTPEYFVKKHKLKLPEVNEENIDISKHTYKSDSWSYFYLGKTDKIDSVYRHLTLQSFAAIKQYEKYAYRNDSIFVNIISIAQDEFDTTVNEKTIITNNYQSELCFNLLRKEKIYLEFTPWGKRKCEKWLRPGDKEPAGQEFAFTKKGDYVEAIETYKGKINLNDIRRYYFTSFDSLCAEYIVKPDNQPRLISLFFYTKDGKVMIEYGIDFIKYFNEVDNYNFYTYTPDGKLFRNYYFNLKNDSYTDKPREYELVNYTEYIYDTLGRKATMITRMVPDKEGER
jgi:hypothetical protein